MITWTSSINFKCCVKLCCGTASVMCCVWAGVCVMLCKEGKALFGIILTLRHSYRVWIFVGVFCCWFVQTIVIDKESVCLYLWLNLRSWQWNYWCPAWIKMKSVSPVYYTQTSIIWGRGHYIMLGLRTLSVVKGTAFLLAVCSCDKGFTKSFIIM